MTILKLLCPAYHRALGSSYGSDKTLLALCCPVRWCRYLSTRIFTDHYQTLGLNADASPVEIKDAYIRLSKVFHPDIYKGQDASEKFQKISTAYQVLSDAEKKSQFDIERSLRPTGVSPGNLYPGNAEYRGGPRRNPTSYAGGATEEFDEWVQAMRRAHTSHRVQNEENAMKAKKKKTERKQDTAYTYFFHTFFGGIAVWLGMTGIIFFTDNFYFGDKQDELRDEMARREMLKELREKRYRPEVKED